MYVPQDASHFLFSPPRSCCNETFSWICCAMHSCFPLFLLLLLFFSIVTLYILEVFTGFPPGFAIVAGRCLRFIPTFCSFNTILRLCNVDIIYKCLKRKWNYSKVEYIYIYMYLDIYDKYCFICKINYFYNINFFKKGICFYRYFFFICVFSFIKVHQFFNYLDNISFHGIICAVQI